MRLAVTINGLLVYIANHYTIRDAQLSFFRGENKDLLNVPKPLKISNGDYTTNVM